MKIGPVKQLGLLSSVIGQRNVKLFKKIKSGIPPYQPSFYNLWIFLSPLELKLDSSGGHDEFLAKPMKEALRLCEKEFDRGKSWTAIFYSTGQNIKPTVEISRYYSKLTNLENVFYCGRHEIGPCGMH